MYFAYLAGGRDTEWREKVRNRWHRKGLRTFDPFRDSRQGAVYEFTEDDLAAVRESDLVFGYCTYDRYSGMALEFGFAHALGIPVIYVAGLARVDSMMAAVSAATFTDLDAAIEHVERRYA